MNINSWFMHNYDWILEINWVIFKQMKNNKNKISMNEKVTNKIVLLFLI